MKRCLPVLIAALLAAPATAEERSRIEISMRTLGDRLVSFSVAVGTGSVVTGERSVGLEQTATAVTARASDAVTVAPMDPAGEAEVSVPRPVGEALGAALAPETGLTALLQSCVLIDATGCSGF